eukprot:GHVU01069791.1.p1 GENE.GHVU01069791.1~~GHVU01069791.1.p1  ORF type:complete len:307 (+),score=12.85 GHVU01069791.1:82-1002(+)
MRNLRYILVIFVLAIGSVMSSPEDVLLLVAAAAAAAAAILHSTVAGDVSEARHRPLQRARVQWQDSAPLIEEEGEFDQMYRMSYGAFMRLVDRLRASLLVDARQSRRRSGTEPATPETMVACALRHLAGGSYHDVRRSFGLSRAYYYDCVWAVIDAINDDDSLAPHFPSTAAEREATALGFSRSTPITVFNRCLGCVDGWLCPIIVPSESDVNRVSSFYSGHYQRFGINVQCCCDCNAKVTAFTINSAGGCNDSMAFANWGLSHVLRRDATPNHLYILADNGYPQVPYTMTPFNRLETPHGLRVTE